MAIQFFCVACRQPIEVDDVMANQTVTRPYCRSRTAPAATDATFRDNPPIARTPRDRRRPPPLPYAVEMPSGPNRWSWASACLHIHNHDLFGDLHRRCPYHCLASLPKDANPQQTNKLLMQEMQARSGLQIIFLTTGLCATPVIAVICGIVRFFS